VSKLRSRALPPLSHVALCKQGQIYLYLYRLSVGRDRAVGIGTRYGLDGTVGARFSAPIQTGPGTQPATYTMGIGSFPGVKRPRRGVDHPSLSSAEVKEGAIPLLPLWVFVACSRMNFTFTFTCTRLSSITLAIATALRTVSRRWRGAVFKSLFKIPSIMVHELNDL